MLNRSLHCPRPNMLARSTSSSLPTLPQPCEATWPGQDRTPSKHSLPPLCPRPMRLCRLWRKRPRGAMKHSDQQNCFTPAIHLHQSLHHRSPRYEPESIHTIDSNQLVAKLRPQRFFFFATNLLTTPDGPTAAPEHAGNYFLCHDTAGSPRSIV